MIETEDSLEILEVPGQAEGESGSETIGFSTFGAQRINDAQKRRARPTSVYMQWNFGSLVAMRTMPTPVAYWGTFVTDFSGKILAGARNDGLGSTTSGWATTPGFSPANLSYSNGSGGNLSLPTLSYNTLGLPGSLCGFDIFMDTTQTDIDISLFYFNPYFPAGVGSITSINLAVNKVPLIGQYYMPSQPAGQAPFLIIRRRPEGYLPNEDGAQVFLSLPYADDVYPAGFIDPAVAGVPVYSNGGTPTNPLNPTRLVVEIIP